MRELEHRRDGTGAPLVLAPSLGTTLELWEEHLYALRRFGVIRYNHPGHGRSPALERNRTIEELGLRVVRLLDRLELQRVSFCGLSLGGTVGLWLAAHTPERVDRLVLGCSAARFGTPGMWEERAATVRSRGMGAIAETLLERWFTPQFREREPATVGRLRAMMLGVSAEGYARCCEAVRDLDLRDDLGRVEAPTLILAGADDPVVGPDDIELLRGGIPAAHVVTLHDAAHLAALEQPHAFAEAVLRHLDDGEAEAA